MSSWGSYPSIFALGHRAIADLLTVDVNVEEKVDGSQFSFGLLPVDEGDNTYAPDPDFDTPLAIRVRSKGAVMNIDAPEALFKRACATVRELKGSLHPGWTYRGEVLDKPNHNALAYERVPKGHIILFDINTGNQEYLSYEAKKAEAERLGLECIPLLFSGRVSTVAQFREFLSITSVLGGQLIEGVVIKPSYYDLYGTDKKVLMGKFVSEAFKEVHRKSWKEDNPSNKDIIGQITQLYTSAARWQKALLHLREKGVIEDSPRDIGLLIREVPEDVFKECEDEMKDILWKHAKKHIQRGITCGLPEWYKDLLLRKQFEEAPDEGHTGS